MCGAEIVGFGVADPGSGDFELLDEDLPLLVDGGGFAVEHLGEGGGVVGEEGLDVVAAEGGVGEVEEGEDGAEGEGGGGELEGEVDG